MMVDIITFHINALLPEPHASLLAGMLFGVHRSMPDEFYQSLIITGTLHVIALSGMNVSIIIRLLFDFLGNVLGKRWGVVGTLLGIGGFVWLVGPSPTIIRASIMGSLTICAVVVGRKSIPLLALGVSAVLMILFDLSLWKNISFQLSFLATLGIILFANKSWKLSKENLPQEKSSKPTKTIGSSLLSLLTSDLKVSLSAQVFTIPVILYQFHRISLISPIANVATGWLVGPIMYGGFLMIVLSLIFRPFGYLAGLIVWVPLTLFIWLVELLAKVPAASISF
ncbi:ComEC/Rec2 family competence protein [Candidatus Roizmanbacteria bacterium]|nr:ComEC/Rec2 family competence protein [Candidatus Roizmanbacteria bacterium]